MNTKVNKKNTVSPVFIDIGNKIKSLRLLKGLSGSELARLTGISKQHISNWENGRRAITLESVLKIQKVLNVPLSEIMCLEEVPPLPSADQKKEKNYLNKNEKLNQIINLLCEQEKTIVFHVTDNTMSSRFRKNDIVIFHKNITPNDGDLVLLSIKKTKQVIFRQYQIDYTDLGAPKVKFTALNASISDIITKSEDDYEIIGTCLDETRITA